MNRKLTLTSTAALSLLLTGAMAANAQAPAANKQPSVASSSATTSSSTGRSQARPSGSASPADLVALSGPTTIVHTGNVWRSTTSNVGLKSGQDILPLTMTITNGVDGKSQLKGIRLFINGRKILTEADFKGRDSVNLNMSGILSGNDTQMEVQTYGPSGASVSWIVTTPKIKISDIKPEMAGPGDKVTIGGRNLPTQMSAYSLTIGTKPATITSVTDKQLTFTVPTGLDGGKQSVTLFIAGVKCDSLTFKVKVIPELSGTNMVACPPSTPMTIYGKGFASNAGDNQVTFNGVTASVTKATSTSLEVIVPNLDFPQAGVDLKVKSSGVDAKNSLKVDLSMRTIPLGESLGPGGPVLQQQ